MSKIGVHSILWVMVYFILWVICGLIGLIWRSISPLVATGEVGEVITLTLGHCTSVVMFRNNGSSKSDRNGVMLIRAVGLIDKLQEFVMSLGFACLYSKKMVRAVCCNSSM